MVGSGTSDGVLPYLLSDEMTEALLGGMAAGYGIAIPVGAIALLIVGEGMRCGFTCAFSAGAGAATADLGYALVAALGGTAVANRLEPWSGPIRLLSGLVLAGIAGWGLWRVRREDRSPSADARSLLGTYGRFLGLTIINPLTIVYFTALVLGSGVVGRTIGSTVAFAAGAFAASLSWQTLLAVIGAFGRRGLSPSIRVVAVVAGNLLIFGLALRLVSNR